MAKIKSCPLKGSRFQEISTKIGENQRKKIWKNRTEFGENRPKFRKKSLNGSQKRKTQKELDHPKATAMN